MQWTNITYPKFLKLVNKNQWTLAQLRCDVRPTPELLEVMDQIGLYRWEGYVRRYEASLA